MLLGKTLDHGGRGADRAFRVRQVALPTEHGAWGFLLEPLVAGVAVAYSPGAPWIVLLVLGAFFLRRPLQVFMLHRLAGRRVPQAQAAFKFVLGFSTVLVVGMAGSVTFADRSGLIPFALVLPFAAYQIYSDLTRQARGLLPEISGAVAISSSAAALALSGGFPLQSAAAIWFLFIARFVPSIIYVRNRLRLEKGKDISVLWPVIAHLVGLAGVVLLASDRQLPLMTIPIFIVLLTRSVIGLSRYRTRMKAMKIGLWEVIYGLLTVLSLVSGHYAGL